MENDTNTNANLNINSNANPNPNNEHDIAATPKELSEIIPKEELTFTRSDKLKMIFGGYLAMLPAFIALVFALLIMYFLILLAAG